MPFKKGQIANPKGRWKKGETGNPLGRPRGTGGTGFKQILAAELVNPGINDSLRDTIRAESAIKGEEIDRKVKMVRRVWGLATEPHDRPELVLQAFDRLAKWGWPEEAAQQAPESPIRIVIVHQEVGGTIVHQKELGE